jgi:hypothetical protein
MSKFPKTLAAARRAEANKLALGEAVIEACRQRMPHGGLATLADISADLKDNDFDDGVTRLAGLRRKAFE